MSKKLVILLLIIGLGAGGYLCYRHYRQAQARSCSFLAQDRITMGDAEYDVWSQAEIAAHGLPFRMVPNEDNAAVLYVKASTVFELPGGPALEALGYVLSDHWVTDREFTEWFDGQRKALNLIHRAVRTRDCQFPVFGRSEDGLVRIETPHVVQMRGFVVLLECEGKREESQDRLSSALGCYFDVFTLARHLMVSDAILFSRLSAYGHVSSAARQIEALVANHDLPPDDVRRAIDRCGQCLDACPGFPGLVEIEIKMWGEVVERIMTDPEEGLRLVASLRNEMDAETRRAFPEVVKRYGNEWHTNWEADCARLRTWAKLPSWEALQPGADMEAVLQSQPSTHYFSRLFLPATAGARASVARVEAQVRGIQIFAAIKLYEKKNARPPASLNDLKGDCISELPKDPFSGRDYVYKVRGRDWILYSVWDNLTDDGGAGSWPHKMSDDKDLIWRNTPIPVEAR